MTTQVSINNAGPCAVLITRSEHGLVDEVRELAPGGSRVLYIAPTTSITFAEAPRDNNDGDADGA